MRIRNRMLALLLVSAMGISLIETEENKIDLRAKSTCEQSDSGLGPKAVSKGVVPGAEVSGLGQLSATCTVSTKKAFQNKLYAYLNKRTKSFTITYKGYYRDVYKNGLKEMFAPIWKIDKATTDDFDYLYGNVSKYSCKVSGSNTRRPKFKFTIVYHESAAQTKKVNSVAKKAIEELDLAGRTRVEQVKLIHDYICETVVYDDSLSKFSAYYGLVSEGHSAVCQGYALLFYKMCDLAGIPCRFVTGTGYTSGKKVPHAWNMVKIDKQWYYVDTTWDDYDSWYKVCGYEYFLKGSKSMSSDHILDSNYLTSSFKKNYPAASEDYQWDIQTPTATPSMSTNDMNTVSTTFPGVTAAPAIETEPTVQVTASPVATVAAEGISREEYGKVIQNAYKKQWKYDKASDSSQVRYDCYLDLISKVMQAVPAEEYAILQKEYTTDSAEKLSILLKSMDRYYNKSVTTVVAEYITSQQFVEDVKEYMAYNPQVDEAQARQEVANTRYVELYNTNGDAIVGNIIAEIVEKFCNSSGSPCTPRCARTYENINQVWLAANCTVYLARYFRA